MFLYHEKAFSASCVRLIPTDIRQPDSERMGMIFRSNGAHCNKIWMIDDCVRSQIVRSAASKRWNASLGLK